MTRNGHRAATVRARAARRLHRLVVDHRRHPTYGGVQQRKYSNDINHGHAGFIAEAIADPAIRRYNRPHDRLGRPAPPLSIEDAEAIIDEFASSWRAFVAAEPPSGVAFAITDVASGGLVGCCGVDDWSKGDVAQFGYWIGPSARGRGYATRAVVLLTRGCSSSAQLAPS